MSVAVLPGMNAAQTIAMTEWKGRISPLFDAAVSILLIRVDKGREVDREMRSLLARQPMRKAQDVAQMGADVLLCGAISRFPAATLTRMGVVLFPFVSGEINEVLDAYHGGTLMDPHYCLPGCLSAFGRRRRRRGQCRRHEEYTGEEQ